MANKRYNTIGDQGSDFTVCSSQNTLVWEPRLRIVNGVTFCHIYWHPHKLLVCHFCGFGSRRLIVLVLLCAFSLLEILLHVLDGLCKIFTTIMKATVFSLHHHREVVFIFLKMGEIWLSSPWHNYKE